jgi:hypothetical protein
MDRVVAKAWDKNPELKKRLDLAGWRYAQLIEVVDLKTDLQACVHAGHDMKADIEITSFIEADRQAYGHFIKKSEHNGKEVPTWYDDEATIFVSEVAEVNKKLAAEWMRYDWP